jgi:AcrR family transcriptional regulator
MLPLRCYFGVYDRSGYLYHLVLITAWYTSCQEAENAMAEGRGRPRRFDSEKALEQVLGLFWEQGYLGTTYADICTRTGLGKPSLYAAFGNKEATFLASLSLYMDQYVRPGAAALEAEPDARKSLHDLLAATVDGLTAEGVPLGCMVATNAACSDASDVPQVVAEAVRHAAAETPLAIAARLRRAAAEGDLAQGASIEALSAFFDALITGLSGMAKRGVQKQELMKAVGTAMSAWPAGNPAKLS